MRRDLKNRNCPNCKEIGNFESLSQGFLLPSAEYKCDARVHYDIKAELISNIGLFIVIIFTLAPIEYSDKATHILTGAATLFVAIGFVYYGNKKRRLVLSKNI